MLAAIAAVVVVAGHGRLVAGNGCGRARRLRQPKRRDTLRNRQISNHSHSLALQISLLMMRPLIFVAAELVAAAVDGGFAVVRSWHRSARHQRSRA